MKGFKLNSSGDVVIENNDIAMVDGNELTRQTVSTLLGTNKKEWKFNEEEGIDFHKILRKNPDYDVIRAEIYEGLKQVDESFILDEFSCELNELTRKLEIKFTATNSKGETVKGGYEY